MRFSQAAVLPATHPTVSQHQTDSNVDDYLSTSVVSNYHHHRNRHDHLLLKKRLNTKAITNDMNRTVRLNMHKYKCKYINT